ncbi:hypothetical protein B0A52_09663 [Exophiala mesophila]|uniref:YAG7-like dimerisation domain-containing protein n=1 Tax=Exophiala mesophila TaxID=212818 RepID=A0A438MT88_EXOME|nr:hypothetical protein B0A52_09663 [Exophiala mesophila]
MSSTATIPVDSKSAKKRKGKVEAANVSGAATPALETTPSETHTNGVETQSEHSYIKELARNIRNIHKKLSASSKADAVIAENPDVPLDDLVAQKKLNADQKAQILKKPVLQAQIAQLEEQLNTFKSFAQELEAKAAKDKAKLIEAHESELAAAKDQAAQGAGESQSKAVENGLRVVSHFLHAAASKRQSEDADTEEGRAFEGALLLVYQGNDASLSTLKNLVNGADERIPDVNGDLLEVTFAQVKQSALQAAQDISEPALADVDDAQPDLPLPETDSTVAHAALTELDDTATLPTHPAEPESAAPPQQSSTGDEAANAVAEASWDPQASVGTESSANNDEWVQVSRDPAETETGVAATPAANHGTGSWAEEVGAAAASEEKAAAENDGFEQVKRDRGRGRGGRGGRGEFRGGRGRGGGGGRGGDGYRGGRGGPPRGRGGPRGVSAGEKN